jgi:hypothetical protein
MRNKWIELMTRRGALACADNSPSNFRAMYRARVAYEGAVEANRQGCCCQESENRRCRRSARPATTQTAPPSKDLIPWPVLTEAGAYPLRLPVSLKAHSRQKLLNRVGDSSV